MARVPFSNQSTSVHVRGVGSFRLPTSEHGTENTAAAVFLIYLLFYMPPPPPPQIERRAEGFSMELCSGYFYFYLVPLPVFKSHGIISQLPAQPFHWLCQSSSWHELQNMDNFQNQTLLSKIVELVSLDVNTWTQGIYENYDAYSIAGFISCGYRQTLNCRISCCLPLFNFSQVYRHCCLLAVARGHSSHRNGEGRIAWKKEDELL